MGQSNRTCKRNAIFHHACLPTVLLKLLDMTFTTCPNRNIHARKWCHHPTNGPKNTGIDFSDVSDIAKKRLRLPFYQGRLLNSKMPGILSAIPPRTLWFQARCWLVKAPHQSANQIRRVSPEWISFSFSYKHSHQRTGGFARETSTSLNSKPLAIQPQT